LRTLVGWAELTGPADSGHSPTDVYPRVGFIVTNLARPAERIVAFHN